MAAPLLVTVLVGVGLGSDPTMVAMNEAMMEALGPDVEVRLQESSAPASRAQIMAQQSPRPTVAWVEWTDSEQRQVVLHVRREPAGDWQERFLRFHDSDAAVERGRTLGFVLASIIRPAPVPTMAKPVVRPESARGKERLWSIEALAIGGLGFGGDADGIGAALALCRNLLPWLGVRTALGARTGVIGSARAGLLTSRVTLGASARWRVNQRWSVGGRLDGAFFFETVARVSDDDRTTRRWRFLPGAAAMLELAYRAAATTEIVLNAGSDMAFGQTSIYVEDHKVSALPMLRGVAEIGLRVSF